MTRCIAFVLGFGRRPVYRLTPGQAWWFYTRVVRYLANRPGILHAPAVRKKFKPAGYAGDGGTECGTGRRLLGGATATFYWHRHSGLRLIHNQTAELLLDAEFDAVGQTRAYWEALAAAGAIAPLG
jgi:hypothetical protein